MLNDISSQRMQKKHEMVARQLRSGLCSTVVLRPLYGEVRCHPPSLTRIAPQLE
jgi:hypothetical protein